jgi:ElaB/YqjD/DUF883 family membrane-anchored ribosome-binding protein
MQTERGTYPGMGDKPHERIPTTPQGAALGETVKASVDRAGDLVKDAADRTLDALASYRDGGVEQLSDDIVEYVRSQPMTALLIATGVGVFVGMLLVLVRKAEGRRHGFLSQ